MENHLPPGTANERTAAYIRGKMAEQRKTATDLAGQLGISRQAAGRRIDGTVTLSLDDCQAISEWLEIPIQNLVQPATDLL
jgi:transcriptional regulator with XRE-family HTH domain